jgi:hypothetical protein
MPAVRRERARVTSTAVPQCTVAANIEWPWEIELKRRAEAAGAATELSELKAGAEGKRAVITAVAGLGTDSYSSEITLQGPPRVQEYALVFRRGSVLVKLTAALADSVTTTIRSQMATDAFAIDRALGAPLPSATSGPSPTISPATSTPTDPIFDAFGSGFLSEEDLKAITLRLKDGRSPSPKALQLINDTLDRFNITKDKPTLLNVFLYMGHQGHKEESRAAFAQIHATMPIVIKMLENALSEPAPDERARIARAAENLMRITIATELYGKPAK